MKFFKTVLSLHIVKLILIAAIALIFLATAKPNSTDKSEPIAKKDPAVHKEQKSTNSLGTTTIAAASQAVYETVTELDGE